MEIWKKMWVDVFVLNTLYINYYTGSYECQFFQIFDYADGQTHYGCVALKQEAKLLLG